MSKAKVPTPFKLDCKDINRDKLDAWFIICKTYLMQSDDYIRFLPGGDNATWTAETADLTRGMLTEPVIPQAAEAAERTRLTNAATLATNRSRRDLATMLTTVAAFCPDGMFRSVVSESTSLQWIYDRIQQACQVQTSGRFLVSPFLMQWNKDIDTVDVFFMKLKSAFTEALQPRAAMYHGVALPTPEALTPLSESMIVIKWLQAIHPSLPQHVQDTKGSLFTAATPTFADIQPELCNIMETLLNELETREVTNHLLVQDDSEGINRIFTSDRSYRSQPSNRRNRGGRTPSFSGRPGFNSRPGGDVRPRQKQCKYCRFTTRKPESMWSSHDTNECFDLNPGSRPNSSPNSSQGGPARVRFLQIPVEVDERDEFDMSEVKQYLASYQAHSTEDTENQDEYA